MTTNMQQISGLSDRINESPLNITKSSDFASFDKIGPSFNGIFQNAVHSLQNLEDDAAAKVNGLLSGDGTDIHTAMIATQKASLTFEAALAVRNKAVSAYQQIMSMQF